MLQYFSFSKIIAPGDTLPAAVFSVNAASILYHHHLSSSLPLLSLISLLLSLLPLLQVFLFTYIYALALDIFNSFCYTISGHSLSEPFWKLPSKRYYPDYYKEIKNPVSLSQIRNKLKVSINWTHLYF